MPAYTRRRLLAGGAAGLAALAGCTTASKETSETPSTSPFVIRNQAEKSRLVSLTVRRGNDVLLDRSYDLSPGERQEIRNPIEGPGRYEIAVELETGTKDSTTWTLGDCERIGHVVIIVSKADAVEIKTERETVSPSACQ